MSDDSMKTIGRYIIEREIGRGGMAIVYQAHDPQLDRVVAIKLIRKSAFPSEQLAPMTERFRREAKALAKLNHPNIVKALDYGVHEDAPYLVMEYIDGVTLKDVRKPLRVDAAVRLLWPVAEALEYVHGQGLLHRDIKPSNIMITRDERVILTDFGIVKWMMDEDDPYTLTGTGLGIGTPEYMAPEQGLGKKIDARADMYALTVVFYELITGVKPYRGETPVDILIKQANDPIPDPREIVPELNPSVKRFLDCAMAKKVEDRYPTMNDYLRDFDGLRLQSIAEAASGKTGIQVTSRREPTTNSSVRFGKTDFRKVREAAGAPSRKIGFRSLGIFAAALLLVGAALLGVLRSRVEPELLSTGTPRAQAAKPEITPTGPSSPTENRPATAAARTAAQVTYRQTEIAAASIERTEMARGTAIQGTASALADRATELASVSLALTERANAPLETEVASLSRTATLLAGSGRAESEVSSNSLDETASAELLIEIGSQDSIHIIASSDEAALTMIAEFQQIRTQAALIQTPESGAESAIDLQIQFPTETPARTNRFANLSVRDTIEFGRYEQDNDLTNGSEPIVWQVLEVSDESAMMITRYGLDKKGYHEKYLDVTWETCSLRNWLNTDFYESAFNEEEKRLIEETRVLNADNPVHGTPGGNSTPDKVFLLSLEEVRRLFPGNRERISRPTYYAEARGAWTSKEEGYVGNAWWWLRSGGLDARQAARIFVGGAPDVDGAYVNDDRGVVRPVIRVRLN